MRPRLSGTKLRPMGSHQRAAVTDLLISVVGACALIAVLLLLSS